MRERELYQQKRAAELDKWRAEMDKQAAWARNADADAQLEANRRIAALKENLEAAQTKLAELVEANDDAWHSIREGVESAWDPLKSVFGEGASDIDE
jgi:flagellar motility protein MotE (MotC chaperone)